jgi:NAD(P)-dependent dehydrogenase (short-subunit alcohol dehydrogenase family)
MVIHVTSSALKASRSAASLPACGVHDGRLAARAGWMSANAVVYLASNEARYITGTVLDVDAGLVNL